MLFVVTQGKGKDKEQGKRKKKDSQAGNSATGSRDARSSQRERKPHNINEVGTVGSGPPRAAALQVSTLTVSG